MEFAEDFDRKISEQKTGIEISANEKKKKKKRRARCRCARSNERGNVLGLRLRSHSDCYHTTGFHFGGYSHLWPVPCALEEVSYPLRYVAFILTRRWLLYRAFFRSHLDSRLTGRWPLCMASLRSHLQVDFRLQLMASLRGLFAFTLTRRKSLTCRWSFWFHTHS
jgi:hypothetical protein